MCKNILSVQYMNINKLYHRNNAASIRIPPLCFTLSVCPKIEPCAFTNVVRTYKLSSIPDCRKITLIPILTNVLNK